MLISLILPAIILYPPYVIIFKNLISSEIFAIINSGFKKFAENLKCLLIFSAFLCLAVSGLKASIKSVRAFIFVISVNFSLLAFAFVAIIIVSGVFSAYSIRAIFIMLYIFPLVYLIFCAFSALIVDEKVAKLTFSITNCITGMFTAWINFYLLTFKKVPFLQKYFEQLVENSSYSAHEFAQILANGLLIPIILIGFACPILLNIREYLKEKKDV